MKLYIQTHRNHYDGMGHFHRLLPTPRFVGILGVNYPVDPGLIVIKDLITGKESEVTEHCVSECPEINWEANLTPAQKEYRSRMGILLGNGGFDTVLRPLEDLIQ